MVMGRDNRAVGGAVSGPSRVVRAVFAAVLGAVVLGWLYLAAIIADVFLRDRCFLETGTCRGDEPIALIQLAVALTGAGLVTAAIVRVLRNRPLAEALRLLAMAAGAAIAWVVVLAVA